MGGQKDKDASASRDSERGETPGLADPGTRMHASDSMQHDDDRLQRKKPPNQARFVANGKLADSLQTKSEWPEIIETRAWRIQSWTDAGIEGRR
jgi:hypothetical protein